MGMILSVYRSGGYDCTANGITCNSDSVCVINVDGPFKPRDDMPAVKLVRKDFSFGASIRLVPVDENGEEIGRPMFGGNYAGTSDSRFSEAVRKLMKADFDISIVKVFDRYEG